MYCATFWVNLSACSPGFRETIGPPVLCQGRKSELAQPTGEGRGIHLLTNATAAREFQRFLWFANLYHHLIRDFSTVATPLTALLKSMGSHLDAEYTEGFQRPKILLHHCSHPVSPWPQSAGGEVSTWGVEALAQGGSTTLQVLTDHCNLWGAQSDLGGRSVL